MKEIDKPLYVKIGKQIKEARIEKGLTLAEVGEKVGKTKVSIKRYEDASVRIDMKTLREICDILDLQVVDAVMLDKNSNETEHIISLYPKGYVEDDMGFEEFGKYLDELSEQMFENFMHLDIDTQRIVLMMLKMENIDEILSELH